MKKINLCIAALAATVGMAITPAAAQDSMTASLERTASIQHAGGPMKVASWPSVLRAGVGVRRIPRIWSTTIIRWWE